MFYRHNDNSKEILRDVIASDFHPGRKSTLNEDSLYLTCLIYIYIHIYIYICLVAGIY
jgi:hypothetical protein